MEVKEEGRLKIVGWVQDHPDVVSSPLEPTPADDPAGTVSKSTKLLSQASAGEPHPDLLKPETSLQDIAAQDGRNQISNTVFMRIPRSELREMSKRLKETCCRGICGSEDFKQDGLSQRHSVERSQSHLKWGNLSSGRAREEKDTGQAALRASVSLPA